MKIHRTFAPRRRFLGATLAVLSILALAGPANAQNWPDRPIKLLVPFAAGGNIDVTGRLMAARLSEALGQQMVVENRVGGGGIIAMEAVQRAAPDGYTLLWASTNVMAIVPATTKVKYDPVKDFAPISELGSSPQVLLVNSKVPAKTVAEFVAYAKAQPAASRLWRRRRTRQRQQPDHGAVPQSRRSQDDQRQLSRHRAGADRRDRRASFPSPSCRSRRRSRRPPIRTFAFSRCRATSVRRALPDVPSIAETYPGYNAVSWTGMLAPAKTPKPIIDKLAAEMMRAAKDPKFVEQLQNAGIDPAAEGPEKFAAFIAAEIPNWAKAVDIAGVKVPQ